LKTHNNYFVVCNIGPGFMIWICLFRLSKKHNRWFPEDYIANLACQKFRTGRLCETGTPPVVLRRMINDRSKLIEVARSVVGVLKLREEFSAGEVGAAIRTVHGA
jgi:hypothetical protein